MTSSSISVVIPTRNRPALLAETLTSVLNQTRLPDEIIIGDDSDDPQTTVPVVSRMMDLHRYPNVRHLTARAGTQAANVERLYASAVHRWICLLHDDDLLLPTAFEILLRAAEDYRTRTGVQPILVYGKQIVVDDDGRENPGATDGLNTFYHRGPTQREDLASNAMLAAIVQQAPNDAYLVDRAAAVATGYNRDPDIGQACDFAFPFRLSKLGPFCYVPQTVAFYRLTVHSVGRGQGLVFDDTALKCYQLLKRELPAPMLAQPLVQNVLRDKARIAVEQAGQAGLFRAAWRIFFSHEHLVSLPTPGFWLRALRLLRAAATRPFAR